MRKRVEEIKSKEIIWRLCSEGGPHFVFPTYFPFQEVWGAKGIKAKIIVPESQGHGI